jgi:hypothetical protein
MVFLKVKTISSTICNCGLDEEMPEHVLKVCPMMTDRLHTLSCVWLPQSTAELEWDCCECECTRDGGAGLVEWLVLMLFACERRMSFSRWRSDTLCSRLKQRRKNCQSKDHRSHVLVCDLGQVTLLQLPSLFDKPQPTLTECLFYY